MAASVPSQTILHMEIPVLEKLVENALSVIELKCILRIILLLSQKPIQDQKITLNDITNDPVITSLLQENLGAEKLGEILQFAEKNNILTSSETKISKKNFSATHAISFQVASEVHSNNSNKCSSSKNTRTENLFAIYEKNISPLTPIIAEEIKKAKAEYPEKMIEEAIIESAKNNARSWRYISRILERWQGEGLKDGRTQRYPARNKRY